MSKMQIIDDFLAARPEVEGAYGYGSGVIKQENYNGNNPQIDLILVPSNIKEWHTENIIKNPEDYYKRGRERLSKLSREKMGGPNNVTYCSQVEYNGTLFKYGTIESSNFINDLTSWETFYVAGRFHKPVLSVKSNTELDKAINKDRTQVFLVACLLSEEITNYYDLFSIICNLSYLGDIRMGIAENPNKVRNIVNGSYKELLDIYSNMGFVVPLKDGQLRINYDAIMKYVELLPKDLVKTVINEKIDYLSSKNLLNLKKAIIRYISNKNRNESIAQAINGYMNIGFSKSASYVLSKIKKMK